MGEKTLLNLHISLHVKIRTLFRAHISHIQPTEIITEAQSTKLEFPNSSKLPLIQIRTLLKLKNIGQMIN